MLRIRFSSSRRSVITASLTILNLSSVSRSGDTESESGIQDNLVRCDDACLPASGRIHNLTSRQTIITQTQHHFTSVDVEWLRPIDSNWGGIGLHTDCA